MVSAVAALVIAELPPADLLAKEREYIRRRRCDEPATVRSVLAVEARSTTMAEWQSRWSSDVSVASWTKRILPSVARYTSRPPGTPITFRLSQALTGHGAFDQNLHRFGIIASPECPHCDAPVDDAEHTLFNCPHWSDLRAEITEALGRAVGPEDVEQLLCSDGGPHPPTPPREGCS